MNWKPFFIALSLIIVFLVYSPTPKGPHPQEYTPGEVTDLDSLSISLDRLANAKFIETPSEGPQDIEIDSRGNIYSGLSDGRIIKITADLSNITVIGKTQGRIFGVDLSRTEDRLAFCDQEEGIKIMDLKSGNIEAIVSKFQGKRFASPNSVVFGPNDETLYFTVSSDFIQMKEFHEMLLYNEGSGSIFEYNLKNKSISKLAGNLYFVNGLEYSPRDGCLYFVETSRSRLMRLDISAENKGKITAVKENIFGYPDNVKISQTGDLWIAIPALRDTLTNLIDGNSILRKAILNTRMSLSMFLAIANMKYSGGLKINPKNGEILEYFMGQSDRINCVSGINQRNGKVYLSSLTKNIIAVIDAKEQKTVTEAEEESKTVTEAKESKTATDAKEPKTTTDAKKEPKTAEPQAQKKQKNTEL